MPRRESDRGGRARAFDAVDRQGPAVLGDDAAADEQAPVRRRDVAALDPEHAAERDLAAAGERGERGPHRLGQRALLPVAAGDLDLEHSPETVIADMPQAAVDAWDVTVGVLGSTSLISTDTLVENPIVAEWVAKSLQVMAEAAEKQGLPIEPHRLTPKVEETFG